MSKIIVSLTTIPSRLPFLQCTIDSIWRQSLPPDEVHLFLPRNYKRSNLGKIDVSLIPDNCTVNFIDSDYGPATKILPCADSFSDSDVSIIYCDDDRVYDYYWIERLYSKSLSFPRSVIAEEVLPLYNRFYGLYSKVFPLRYRFFRIISYRKWPFESKVSNSFIVQGFGGVLVHPSFFPSWTFDVPDCLFAVDDIWLSAVYAKQNIPIVCSSSGDSLSSPVLIDNLDVGSAVDSLKASTFNDKSRMLLDFFGIKYVRRHLNIW